MRRYSYRKGKQGTGRFVQLPEWVQASEAWATLPPGPRCLYIELKRRFNGSNNGRITLSHREAAKLLNCHRNTVGPWFRELEERGFIRAIQGYCLGPTGVGQTVHWALEELPLKEGQPAGKAFMRWAAKQNPRTKYQTACHNKQDGSDDERRDTGKTVLKFVTAKRD